MSSRYYNNQYVSAAPYSSPYRERGARYAHKASPKGKTRQSVIPGPYSPTLGRKRPFGHWKAKKKPTHEEDEEKRTKRGEFNQEAIEAELNKYKKGVFYHDDDAPKINGHEAKYRARMDRLDKYSQYQLTRTQHPPPQVYEDLPRAVPPNYDERRLKTTDHPTNDDSKSGEREELKRQKVKKDKKRRKKRDKVANAASPQQAPYDYYPHYNYSYYGDSYSSYYGAVAAQQAPPTAAAGYSGDYYNIFGYDHGVIQDDGSWYPYPDILQHPSPKPTRATPPKISVRSKENVVDLTNNTSDKRMSPGRRVNKIQKQLEYYFSPQNMNTDEFLRESMDSSGWVNVQVICGFNRMKVLGASKELVVEAAYHSTSIEIDSKNPDKIRMTKYWKQYISEKTKRKKRKEKERERERRKEKELDDAEINQETIESIVAGIERKHLKRKKRRAQREKETEKKDEEEVVKDKKDVKKDEEVKENSKLNTPPTKKEKEKQEEEDADMVEID